MNGIYAMYYTGLAGSGHAVIVMKNDTITGADAVGVLLDGTYGNVNDGRFKVSIKLVAPAGTPLVTGVVAGREPMTQQINTELPANFGNGNPIGVQTPDGQINVVFKRLRDVP